YMIGSLANSLSSLGNLPLNHLAFDGLFSSALPSYIRVTPTNPLNTDISTADTIALMDSHAIAGASHPLVLEAVEEIQASAASDSEQDIIEATYEYVKGKVTFTEDEELLGRMFGTQGGVELLITPPRLLSMHNPMGDCDDFSMLTKCLLYAQGIDTSLTTIAADSENPDKWSHVYLTHDKTGTSIDASHGKMVGWEAPLHNRKTAWVNKEEKHMIQGNDGMGDVVGDDGNIYSDSGVLLSTNTVQGSGINWGGILAPLSNVGSWIALAQFGQPQLAPGTFIRNADGSILTNQPISGGLPLSLGTGSGIGSSGLLLAAGAIVLLLVLKK